MARPLIIGSQTRVTVNESVSPDSEVCAHLERAGSTGSPSRLSPTAITGTGVVKTMQTIVYRTGDLAVVGTTSLSF